MPDILIKSQQEEEMTRVLEINNFEVVTLDNDVLEVTRDGELPVFIKQNGEVLYFEVDLGNISEIASEGLYFKLLDTNTEILPVSFGINNTNPKDPRLVLVESREIGDLCSDELLSVFDAMELAADKAAVILEASLKFQQ